MPNRAAEKTRKKHVEKVPKERKNSEEYKYSDQDACNLLQCYIDTDGDIDRTISVFESRHGIKATNKFVKKVLWPSIKGAQYVDPHRDGNGAVKIKEEIEYLPEESANSKAINVLQQENSHFLSDTYVYTTRLDEMDIFNTDFSNLSVKTIERHIILESKPDKSKMQINKYRCKYGISTKRLFEKIGIYNAMIRKQKANSIKVENNSAPIDISRESLQLLKLCKPLTVPLINCLKYPLEITKINNTPKNVNRIANFDNINQDVFIVMKNIFTVNTEIYYIPYGSKSPAVYHEIDHVINGDDELFQYVDNTIMELVNCCWFSRQNNIEKISMSRFLKKPHPCQSSQLCNCCCRQMKHDSLSIPIHKTYWPIQNDNTLLHVNELKYSIGNAQSFINKALFYANNHTKVNTQTPPPPQCIKKSIRLTLKTKKETEYFKSGYNYASDIYMIAAKNMKSLLACCWYKRNSISSHLEYPESTLISEPHNCPSAYCYCCCRPTNIRTNKKLPIISLSDNLHNYRSKYIQDCNFKGVQCKRQNKSNENIKCSPSSTSTPPILSQLNNSLSTESNTQPVVPNQAYTQPLVNQEPNIQIITNKPFQDPALKDPVVSSIFTSILDKYKNIRLTVDTRGLVSASLDTPIDQMSTEDLKMLADLLKQVQKQVNSLKQIINTPPAENLPHVRNPPPWSTNQGGGAEIAATTATLAVPIISDPPVFMTLPNSAPQNMENKSQQVSFDTNAVDGKDLSQKFHYLTQKKIEQYRLSYSYKSHSQRRTSQNVRPLSKPITSVSKAVTPLSQSITPLSQSLTPLSQSVTPSSQAVTSLPESVTPLSQPVIQNVFSLKDFVPQSKPRKKRKSVTKKNETVAIKRLRVKTPAELAAAASPRDKDVPKKASLLSFNDEFCNFIQPPVVKSLIQPLIPVGTNDLSTSDAHPNIIDALSGVPSPLVAIPFLINNPANTANSAGNNPANSVVGIPNTDVADPMMSQSNESTVNPKLGSKLEKIPEYQESRNFLQSSLSIPNPSYISNPNSNNQIPTNINDDECILGY